MIIICIIYDWSLDHATFIIYLSGAALSTYFNNFLEVAPTIHLPQSDYLKFQSNTWTILYCAVQVVSF